MMLQIGDDGVVSSVDEENLIYVDKNELEQFIESYRKLEEENEQLKRKNQRLEKQKNVLIDYMDNWCPKRFYDGIIKRMEEVE